MHTYISAQAWLWVAAAQAGAESVREGGGGAHSFVCFVYLAQRGVLIVRLIGFVVFFSLSSFFSEPEKKR